MDNSADTASVQEMFNLTIEAFNLSETYRVPTLLMADEIVVTCGKSCDPPPEKLKIVTEETSGVSDNTGPSTDDDLFRLWRVSEKDIISMPLDWLMMKAAIKDIQLQSPVWIVNRLCQKIRRTRTKLSYTKNHAWRCRDHSYRYGIVPDRTKRSEKARENGIKADCCGWSHSGIPTNT